MTKIILDWSKHILIVDDMEYKYFEVNCDCHGNVPLCDIYILDGDNVVAGTVKRKDVVFIND